jgi:hypothetical protein
MAPLKVLAVKTVVNQSVDYWVENERTSTREQRSQSVQVSTATVNTKVHLLTVYKGKLRVRALN